MSGPGFALGNWRAVATGSLTVECKVPFTVKKTLHKMFEGLTGSERLYRSAVAVLVGLSGLVLGTLIAVGRPILGVVGFGVLLGGTVAIETWYDGPLHDERDRRRHERAAGRTLTVFGWASAILFPTLTLFVALDRLAWPAWLTPIALVVPLVYGTYGGFALLDGGRR